MEQIAGRHGKIFSLCRVVLQARQLEEEELLEGLSMLHRGLFYHSSMTPTNAARGWRNYCTDRLAKDTDCVFSIPRFSNRRSSSKMFF
jgi:hypothetical protein